MSLEQIGLILIIAFLAWRLFGAIGQSEEQSLTSNKTKSLKSVTKKLTSSQQNVWNDDEFLTGAKIAFHMISSAFAQGKKRELKIMLAPQVYDTFLKDIETRENKKQSLDFSLICVNSAKILKKAEAAREVTVQFISEQINILKDENGEPIEGDPMSVSTMRDTWTFRKKKNDTWIVCATKSEASHA